MLEKQITTLVITDRNDNFVKSKPFFFKKQGLSVSLLKIFLDFLSGKNHCYCDIT